MTVFNVLMSFRLIMSAFYQTSLTKGSNSAIKGKCCSWKNYSPDIALYREDWTAAGRGTVHYSTV